VGVDRIPRPHFSFVHANDDSYVSGFADMGAQFRTQRNAGRRNFFTEAMVWIVRKINSESE